MENLCIVDALLNAKYTAASHVWGEIQSFKTTKVNLDDIGKRVLFRTQ
jgi:hypothetical protein